MRLKDLRSIISEQSNTSYVDGQLILLLASSGVTTKKIDDLIRHGADVNLQNCWPLEIITSKIHDLLKKAATDPRYKSDVLEQSEDLIEILKHLIKKGAGLNSSSVKKMKDIEQYFYYDRHLPSLVNAAIVTGELLSS